MPTDTAARIEALFTRSDGGFRFARWARPPAPAVFGTDREGQLIVEEALALASGLTGLRPVAEDPDLGSNFLVFFVERWSDLTEVGGLDRLIPDLGTLIASLTAEDANQYRIYSFDAAGAIRLTLTLLCLDRGLRQVPARALALSQCVQALLLWSDTAFRAESPVIRTEDGRALLEPWFADLVRVAYDPGLPDVSTDPAHSGMLAERIERLQAERTQ